MCVGSHVFARKYFYAHVSVMCYQWERINQLFLSFARQEGSRLESDQTAVVSCANDGGFKDARFVSQACMDVISNAEVKAVLYNAGLCSCRKSVHILYYLVKVLVFGASLH